MCGADLRQHAVAYHEAIVATEWRVRHHRHVVLLAPWQKVMLNASVVETVRDLIGRAAITVWDTEEIFHLASVEVGYAPSSDFPCRAQLFESCDDVGELGIWNWPVQQIEIEIIGPETRRLASHARAMPSPVTSIGLHFGDEEYSVTLTGNHMAYQFLRAAVSVISRRVDQRHAERNACAQRLFLKQLPDVCPGRDARSPDRQLGQWCRSATSRCAVERRQQELMCLKALQSLRQRRERQTDCRAKCIKLAPAEQMLVHLSISTGARQ